MWHSFVDNGRRVDVDLSTQELAIDIRIEDGLDWDTAEIAPAIQFDPQWGIVSVAALAQKAKQFDDGLYAAVELAAQREKTNWLFALARKHPLIGTAAHLGGATDVPIDQALLDEFLGNEGRSKPIGFYTWSDALKRIFQQDRFLQRDLEPDQVAALAPLVGGEYRRYLELVEKLTNPFVGSDLRKPVGNPVRFCPPSRAHETDLVKELFSDRPIPADFNVADEMIARIRNRRLRLTPTQTSGWYDFQTWALEPLAHPEAAPEAARVRFGERYKPLLLELFRALLALTRETHIKQLEEPLAGARMRERRISVAPILSAEPLPTYYLRRAVAYRFIATVLGRYFGQALQSMRRETPDGPNAQSLLYELAEIEALFYGAHALTNQELGLVPDPQLGYSAEQTTAAIERFRAWNPSTDPDVGRDSRMMVPIYYDIVRRQRRCWAFLGWVKQRVKISFAGPLTIVVDNQRLTLDPGRPDPKVPIDLENRTVQLHYPIVAEVYASTLYDRDEFRRRCDALRSRAAIVQWLEGKTAPTVAATPPRDRTLLYDIAIREQFFDLPYNVPYATAPGPSGTSCYVDFPFPDFTLRYRGGPFEHEGKRYYAFTVYDAKPAPDWNDPHLDLFIDTSIFEGEQPYAFSWAGRTFSLRVVERTKLLVTAR